MPVAHLLGNKKCRLIAGFLLLFFAVAPVFYSEAVRQVPRPSSLERDGLIRAIIPIS